MKTTVLLVDDQPLLRAGFRMVLEEEPDLSIVGEAEDGAEAVRLTAELAPDVVLMDIRMPGMDGVEATRRIVEQTPQSRVLVLTTFDLDEYVFSALRRCCRSQRHPSPAGQLSPASPWAGAQPRRQHRRPALVAYRARAGDPD